MQILFSQRRLQKSKFDDRFWLLSACAINLRVRIKVEIQIHLQ